MHVDTTGPTPSEIMDKLFALSSRILHGATLEDALGFIYREFHGVVPFDRIGFADIDVANQTVTSRWAHSRRSAQLRIGYTAPLAGSSLALVLEHRKPRIMNDLLEYLAHHPSSRSTELITREGVRSSMTCPRFLNDEPYGFLFFSSEDTDTYNELHVKILKEISNQLALLLMASRVEAPDTEQQTVPHAPQERESTVANARLRAMSPRVGHRAQRHLHRTRRRVHRPLSGAGRNRQLRG